MFLMVIIIIINRDLRQFWRKLGDIQVLGITCNYQYGGSDGQYLDHVIIMEELSRFVLTNIFDYH